MVKHGRSAVGRQARGAMVALAVAVPACSWNRAQEPLWDDVARYEQVLQQTAYEDADSPAPPTTATAAPPIMIDDTAPQEYWDLTLQQAVELALAKTAVLRELGGALIGSPDLVETVHQPSIRETDPNLGSEAALSEFDAVYSSNVIVEKNDRALNNLFTGGGTQLLEQDLAVKNVHLKKGSLLDCNQIQFAEDCCAGWASSVEL